MKSVTTDAEFDKEVASTEKLVLVDFFATWCGPCSVLSPILDKLSSHFKEKVVFIKADVDLVPKAAQKFNVEKIPTIVLLKNNKPINGFVGLIPENSIKEWLENIIKEQK